MTKADVHLTRDFPSHAAEDWQNEAKASLRGNAGLEKLDWVTYEGIRVAPIGFAADDPKHPAPGTWPFTRGTKARATMHPVQLVDHPDPEGARRQAADAFENDIHHVALRLDDAARLGNLDELRADADRFGRGGVAVRRASDLALPWGESPHPLGTLSLYAGRSALAATALASTLSSAPARDIHAGIDPLGALASSGALDAPAERELARLGEVVHFFRNSQTRPIAIDTGPYHDAGASEALDLALSMATGVAYLRALSTAGLDTEAAVGALEFRVRVGAELFLTIAKLRAGRWLWARVTEVLGVENGQWTVEATTAARMLSTRDPWVNLLRQTVAAFGATVGGADSTVIEPFTGALGPTPELALRIARNTGHLLHEESFLGNVLDPAGGAWYVERLTADLAEKAWSLFQDLEREGGLAAALASGYVQANIEEAWEARSKNLHRRKDALTGVSEFASLDERPVEPAAVDWDELRARARTFEKSPGPADSEANFDRLVDAAREGATLQELRQLTTEAEGQEALAPLPRRRFSEDWEELRNASDAYGERTGQRPSVFLASLGPLSEHTPRTDFARGFFHAGGIDAVGPEHEVTEPNALAEAFTKSGLAVAVLCSSDAIYAERAADAARALKTAGAKRVLLAGRPGQHESDWREAGVDEFIFLGVDVFQTLSNTHTVLEVGP